jgi:Protein of unknown function (DUF2283)
MKSTYFDQDDILSIRVSDKPIVREVSHSWHINTSYAADGTVVEVVLLDAHKDGQQSIERVAVTTQILKSLNVPDADIEAIEAAWKPIVCSPLPKTSKTNQRRLIPTPKALEKALKLSADRAQRLAAAFGLKVPGIKPKAAKP